MDKPQEEIIQNFEIIAYDKPDGTFPAYEFIDSLPKKFEAKVHRDVLLLGRYGNDPQGKLTKSLGDGIFELRSKHSSHISRVLYFFRSGKKIILTHGFVKKTQKTPQNQLDLAKKYRKEYIERENKK